MHKLLTFHLHLIECTRLGIRSSGSEFGLFTDRRGIGSGLGGGGVGVLGVRAVTP